MTSCFIEAEGPNGKLIAAVDPSARHVEGKPAALKFAALLTPFRDPETARAALEAAGATLPNGGR
jgi:hypothetical protein